MGQSFSYDEQTVRHQFDRVCQMALKGEVANYYREMDTRRKHEVPFSDLPKKNLENFFVLDEYEMDSYQFRVLDYDVEVKDTLIAEALEALSERKREIILLSFFLDMKDAEIARALNIVQSAIYAHKKRSLELLKKILERKFDEEGK